ncbi:glutathione peroxidase [Thioclava dalianensis]|nr:glutathione peroxidase [Thioclava dalianensis]SFN17057.1 glutathione peroxidase [Thioclava dalianensis]
MFARICGFMSGFAVMIGLAVASPAMPPNLSFDLVEGGKIDLTSYEGKVILVVNTASKCGYAPQFTQLQDLSDRYWDQGLVILTVPSNDFKQELSTAEAAKQYCAMTFGAELPMARITQVTGTGAHPFYAWLRAERGFEPSWNFNKVLIGRDGRVIDTYPASVEPASQSFTGAIETALGQGRG